MTIKVTKGQINDGSRVYKKDDLIPNLPEDDAIRLISLGFAKAVKDDKGNNELPVRDDPADDQLSDGEDPTEYPDPSNENSTDELMSPECELVNDLPTFDPAEVEVPARNTKATGRGTGRRSQKKES